MNALPYMYFPYCRDLRQEVTVLAQLSHPNIVALLGVSIRPMCMVIEFAPMGSLFGTLDKTVEQIAKTVVRNRGEIRGLISNLLSLKRLIRTYAWTMAKS